MPVISTHFLRCEGCRRNAQRAFCSPPHPLPQQQRSCLISAWFSHSLSGSRHVSTERSMEKATRWYYEEGGHGNPTLSSFNCDHKSPWPNSMMCCLDSCFSETPVSAKPVYYADSRTMNFNPSHISTIGKSVTLMHPFKELQNKHHIPIRKPTAALGHYSLWAVKRMAWELHHIEMHDEMQSQNHF